MEPGVEPGDEGTDLLTGPGLTGLVAGDLLALEDGLPPDLLTLDLHPNDVDADFDNMMQKFVSWDRAQQMAFMGRICEECPRWHSTEECVVC